MDAFSNSRARLLMRELDVVNQIRPIFCLLLVAGFTIGILTFEGAKPCCATDVKAEFAKLVEDAILQLGFK